VRRLVLACLAAVAVTLARPAAALAEARAPAAGWTPREGRALVGKPAPEWQGIRWLQGGPLTLASLRGKAVLLRFWSDECPYCSRTAPVLSQLAHRYRADGLVVVGIHHPKSDEGKDPAYVLRSARAMGIDFPVGTDRDWTTLRAYGVGTEFQRFTSVSVLIDRAGVIRFVHDGGEFHPGTAPEHADCDAAYQALVRAIGEVLGRR
jgi:thiol-disulfide isomerase/thioredoxin